MNVGTYLTRFRSPPDMPKSMCREYEPLVTAGNILLVISARCLEQIDINSSKRRHTYCTPHYYASPRFPTSPTMLSLTFVRPRFASTSSARSPIS